MQDYLNNLIHYQYGINVENLVLEILMVKSLSSSASPITDIVNHIHPYIELFVCIKDHLALKTPDEVIYLNPGDAAIIPPQIPHHSLMDHDNAVWQAVSFSFQKLSIRECHDVYSQIDSF